MHRIPSGYVTEISDEGSIKYCVKDVRNNKSCFFCIVKRMVDILFSLILTVTLFVPMLIIALIIVIDSPGCPLFCQERLGKDGKKFCIFKFRSMYKNAEANGPQWANKNDERCTRVGRLLRKTRIDEIPQVFNILNGTMSIVGPRPERKCFYEEFSTYIDGFDKRLAVKPGLTGLAQVNGGYDLAPHEKVAYDMQYIEKCSILLDLKCCVKTIKLVFTQEGAR